MPNSPFIDFTDNKIDQYKKDLERVMRSLNDRIVDLMSAKVINRPEDLYDTAAILNMQPDLIKALTEAGYSDLSEEFVRNYERIVETTEAAYSNLDLPSPRFAAADAKMFQQIASADLERFEVIGANAMNELRFQMYRQALTSAPFSTIAASVAAATVGTASNGSPLAAYAGTHANTAIQGFAAETIKTAAINIDHDDDDDLWQVVGPSDRVTREVCSMALSAPIRTRAEWKQAPSDFPGSYFDNNPPGGWNCRHQLFPYVSDD